MRGIEILNELKSLYTETTNKLDEEQIILNDISNENQYNLGKLVNATIYNSGYNHETIIKIADLFFKDELNTPTEYIIIDNYEYEPRTIVIEKDGNVLISDLDHTLQIHSTGDKFTIRGEEYVADIGVSNDIELITSVDCYTLSNAENIKIEPDKDLTSTLTNKFDFYLCSDHNDAKSKRKNKFKI